MNYPKADIFKRFIAYLIDGIISSILIYVPVLGGIAVSYTHLDVYKRQGVRSADRRVVPYRNLLDPNYKRRILNAKAILCLLYTSRCV